MRRIVHLLFIVAALSGIVHDLHGHIYTLVNPEYSYDLETESEKDSEKQEKEGEKEKEKERLSSVYFSVSSPFLDLCQKNYGLQTYYSEYVLATVSPPPRP